jgi:hypothetical protein
MQNLLQPDAVVTLLESLVIDELLPLQGSACSRLLSDERACSRQPRLM